MAALAGIARDDGGHDVVKWDTLAMKLNASGASGGQCYMNGHEQDRTR